MTPWTAARKASVSSTISQSLLKIIHSMMPSNHRILCSPLFLLPLIFPSISIFSNEPVLYIRWPKYWSPSNEYSELIPLGLTSLLSKELSSLLQHHSLKTSTLRHSAFFMVQLSHPYMTTGKSIALKIETLVSKVMSLVFNREVENP